MRILKCLFLLMFISLPSFADEIDPIAVKFVETLGLGNGLIPMASNLAKNTQTYKMVSSEIGEFESWNYIQMDVANCGDYSKTRLNIS